MKYAALLSCIIASTIAQGMETNPLSILARAAQQARRAKERYLKIDGRLVCPDEKCGGISYKSRSAINKHISARHPQSKTLKDSRKNRYYRQHYRTMRSRYACPLQDPRCADAPLPFPSTVIRHMRKAHKITISIIEARNALRELITDNNTFQQTEDVLQQMQLEAILASFMASQKPTAAAAEKIQNF